MRVGMDIRSSIDMLARSELWWVTAMSSALLLSWYWVVRGTTNKTEKQCAWIMTLLSSLVCIIGCGDVIREGLFGDGFTSPLLYGTSRRSRFLMHFFLSYLVWDCAVMFVDFPSVGGLMHHIPYFIFMALSLYFECPNIFVVFFPLEISTVFLASGQIWPQYRADIPFGITFFFTRVVYHIALWYRLYVTRDDSPFYVWPFSLLPWFVHCIWFSKWLVNQLKSSKKRNHDKD